MPLNNELLTHTVRYGMVEIRQYLIDRVDHKRAYYSIHLAEVDTKECAYYPIEYPLLRACKEHARNVSLPYNHPSRTDAQDIRFSDQYYVSGTMEIRSRQGDSKPSLYIYEDTAFDIRVPLRLTANMQKWGIGPFCDYQKCEHCVASGCYRGVFVSLCVNCAQTCRYVYGFGVEIAYGKIVDVASASVNVDQTELVKMVRSASNKKAYAKFFNAETPEMIEYVYMKPRGSDPTIYAKFNTKIFGATRTYLSGVDETQIGYSDNIRGCSSSVFESDENLEDNYDSDDSASSSYW